MSTITQLIAAIKSSRADGKIKVISQVPDLLQNYSVKDKDQERVNEELISLINACIKAPQFPLALKAIETLVPVLEFLITNSHSLKAYITLILPTLLERLGDGKERIRDASIKALIDSWRILSVGDHSRDSGPQRRTKALEHFTKLVIDGGFSHKTPWGREQSLSWCIDCIAKDPDFPLQKFTTSVLSLAEDTNESVREKAKTLLFDFFPVVSQESKTSLQRALADSKLKKSLVDQLTHRILGSSKPPSSANHGHRQTLSGTEIPPSLQCLFEGPDTSREKIETPDLSSASSDASVPESRHSALSLKSPPHQLGGLQSAQTTSVYDSKDLQRRLALLSKAFVGKESDLNWDSRDRELHNFRQLLRGNAATDYADQLVVCLKEFMESLNKTLLSLRTTLAISALNTVADLSRFLPDGTLDPYCFLIFPTLLKTASSTKKLLAETAHTTVLSYLAHTSYNLKTLGLICSSLSDRSAQLRVYGVSYLIAFLTRHSGKPQQFEKRGLQVGIDLVKGALSKALSDANPKARELARQAFSIVHSTWPSEAQELLKTLNASTRKQLSHIAPSTTAPPSATRPSTRLGTMQTRATEAPPATRPPSTVRNLRPQKSCISLRTAPVSRPSSVMVTRSDRQYLDQGVKARTSFFRSPSALAPPSLSGDNFYTPPRDLNTGTLATDPGISRIPRPPISRPRPVSVATHRPASAASNHQPTRPTPRTTPSNRPLSLLSPPAASRNSLLMAKASSEGNDAPSPRLRLKKGTAASQSTSERSQMTTIVERPASPEKPVSAKPSSLPVSNVTSETNPQAELHKLLDHELSFSPAELRKLLRLSRELPLPDNNIAWVRSKNFSRLIRGCVAHLQAAGPSAESLHSSVLLLESLMKNQTALCDSHASDLLTTLVECQQSKLRDVSSSAEDALKVFAQKTEPTNCINITIRYLQACLLIEKGSLPEFEDLATPTSSGFFVLAQLIPRLPQRYLFTVQSDLDSLVGSGFHHSSPTVRHHVLSLVLAIQAHLGSGHRIQEFFPRLTPSQLRLVNLYLESW